MNISGPNNSSGYANVDVDMGYMARIKTGQINKSPVLYLRRRRNTDFDRHIPYRKNSRAKNSVTQLNWKEEKFLPVDDGSIYPHHGSRGRIGSIEWAMFRDYKRRKPKWIRTIDLVIDGTVQKVIT